STLDLQTRIRDYRRLPLHKLTDEEAREAIWKIIAPSQHASYVPLLGRYPKGSIFWRARSIPLDDHILPLRSMRTIDDAWAPKSEFVRKRGRLNRANESLLYTCPANAALTVQEARIPEGQRFSLIKYTSREPINVVQILASDTVNWGLSEDQRIKYEMLMDFFETEFTRGVGEGNEYFYRSSEFIAKDHFDLPQQVQDAWLYPSTVGKPAVNVTFRPEVAHKKLRLEGIALCKWKSHKNGIRLAATAFTDGNLGNTDSFIWWSMGTDVQKSRFPEFGL
ncbi:hypothetical protein, partial [Glutamicibacter ardleyensis]|uniref:hypothetical protein n=1 Tax=Glutamicibacter ardleyensis TaxID=225894 RepID=UPI003FD60FB1